jgi:hypothetical protein
MGLIYLKGSNPICQKTTAQTQRASLPLGPEIRRLRMTGSTLEPQKVKRPDLSTEEKIAKAEARIKKLRKAQKENTRKIEDRKKIIAGVALFKAFEVDADLKTMVLPALQAAINARDFEFVFGD